MRLSTAEAAYTIKSKATLLKVQGGEKTIVGIFDGTACWGWGRDAAAWSRVYLEARWAKSVADLTRVQVQSDIAQLHRVLPETFQQDEWRASFSVSVVIVEDLNVSIVAAGTFSVFVPRGQEKVWLFKAQTLVNQLLDEGKITKEQALEFPHKNMFVGPVINSAESAELVTATYTLQPGDTLIATQHAKCEALSFDDVDGATSAREIQKLGPSHQAGFAAVIMLRP